MSLIQVLVGIALVGASAVLLIRAHRAEAKRPITRAEALAERYAEGDYSLDWYEQEIDRLLEKGKADEVANAWAFVSDAGTPLSAKAQEAIEERMEKMGYGVHRGVR